MAQWASRAEFEVLPNSVAPNLFDIFDSGFFVLSEKLEQLAARFPAGMEPEAARKSKL